MLFLERLKMDTVCYWDSTEARQKERYCTAEEQTDIDTKRAQAVIDKIPNQWKEIRKLRIERFKQHDLMVIKSISCGFPMPATWISYGKALRNITLQNDPFNVTWPTEPEIYKIDF